MNLLKFIIVFLMALSLNTELILIKNIIHSNVYIQEAGVGSTNDRESAHKQQQQQHAGQFYNTLAM